MEIQLRIGLFLTKKQWNAITMRTKEAYSRLRNDLQHFGSPRTYREWDTEKQVDFRKVLLQKMKPLTTEVLHKLENPSTSDFADTKEMFIKIAPEGLAMMTYVMEQFVKSEDLDDVTMLLSDLMTELIPEKDISDKSDEKTMVVMTTTNLSVMPKDVQLLLVNMVGGEAADRLITETEAYLLDLRKNLLTYEPINKYREWDNAKKKDFQRVLLSTLGPAKKRIKALSDKNITSISDAVPAIVETFMPEGVAVAMYLSGKFTEPHHANDALALVSDLLHDLLPEKD